MTTTAVQIHVLIHMHVSNRNRTVPIKIIPIHLVPEQEIQLFIHQIHIDIKLLHRSEVLWEPVVLIILMKEHR